MTSEALLAVDAFVRRYGSTAAFDAARMSSAAWIGQRQDDAGTWNSGLLAARTGGA